MEERKGEVLCTSGEGIILTVFFNQDKCIST